MCGICGTLPKIDFEVLKRSLSNIAHRGPDGEGTWTSPGGEISLGHRRLVVIDRSQDANQPMHYLGKYVIVFNGEIYNFLELRKELEALGHKFNTQSDTEVVVAAYCEWKENCLLKFNGMWAFCIWDKVEKSLFLSRDRFGVKPLFYSLEKGRFVFGSEMKAIYPFLDSIEPSKSFKWCSKHIFEYEATEKTLVKGIKRFLAGHYAIYKPELLQLRVIKYWDTIDHLIEIPNSYPEQVEFFRDLFLDAVKLRMRSDVRIGTTLSGGLDSSAVISTMAQINTEGERLSEDWQHAFVACFKGTFLDERKYAQRVVDHLNIPATFVEVKPPDFSELLSMLYNFEDIYTTSPVPMMNIYRELRKNGVVVSIDGHGADELLSGYGVDLKYALFNAGLDFASIKSIYKASESRLAAYSNFGNNSLGIFKYFKTISMLIAYQQKKSLVNKRFLKSGGNDYLNAVLYNLFHNTVLPTLLRNYDRYSMNSGVEVRMPFMDYRIVTFLFSLPWTGKIRNGYSKAVLRDAVNNFMPNEITWRNTKIGFSTPVIDWVKNEWKEPLYDMIMSPEFNNSNLINHRKIKNYFNIIIAGKNVKFATGEKFWKEISPFLWQKSLECGS